MIVRSWIANGSYGDVFKCEINGDIVALKKIAFAKQNIRRVQNEVSILEKLQACEHIVKLINVKWLTLSCEIMMQYYETNLHIHVETRKKLTEYESFLYFRQIESAIKWMHKNNIVHRDIKLDNCLLSNEQVVLCDFGLAHLYTHLNFKSLTGRVGSVRYCAPEVIERGIHDGRKSDIWSLGVCLFVMLCGYYPFEEASFRDWRYTEFVNNEEGLQYVISLYELEERLSDRASQRIHKMIVVDPEKREM